MHASQHCITPRDRLVVSVSRLRIETFRDHCHVAVGLIVPRVLCLGHKLGVITQSHNQTVTTHPGYGQRDPWSSRLDPCQLGDLLDGPDL